ncbi:MAG: TIGR03757 family integrating conjugative element protein [Gammaproteobacteria bacterium]|nr:TIGR03757 family integrating conjugative element protein [Gammaproteobacteria bacterium]
MRRSAGTDIEPKRRTGLSGFFVLHGAFWREDALRCLHDDQTMAFSSTLTALALTAALLWSGSPRAAEAMHLEVFAAAEDRVDGQPPRQWPHATVAVYRVDGLAELESVLSQALPADVKVAQAEAARRIGRLDDTQIAAAKNAATGLAKARQYGLDRYPAIVVNGRAVLYGVTDLADAAQRYGAWLEARSR